MAAKTSNRLPANLAACIVRHTMFRDWEHLHRQKTPTEAQSPSSTARIRIIIIASTTVCSGGEIMTRKKKRSSKSNKESFPPVGFTVIACQVCLPCFFSQNTLCDARQPTFKKIFHTTCFSAYMHRHADSLEVLAVHKFCQFSSQPVK